ncbi:TPA: glycosyltransferase [Vibrio vulnificus]|uniref:Glycosyl transferase n=1 Tax=Vibrio vulnificus TaxID=672 RepID=A0A2S3R663_VIBVL|nr:glycosyltransferase [Vibrio vulnificus]EJB8415355.1 glycosyltransferase [Vibrio vulnificus]ELP6757226.1 glycosyltransferase [Vibrio vulnificus]MBN8095542.1 glycosyltransferase [Vibrio vulnificus]MDK2620935.1 glycosyltransferase [Vibrio vulnificus]POB49165.1 glycosyl transferase [Vibrio vulnificus]
MEKKAPKASLIIAFYNNTQALELIFRALEVQSETNFEVIIADDGSKKEAVEYILERRKTLPFSVNHIWHEDKGFRKNRILNHAILASKSEYLIFIDGDCIPQRHFIEDHICNAELGKSLSGRRAELADRFTEDVLHSVSPGTFFEDNKFKLLWHYLTTKGQVKEKGRHVEKGLRLSSSLLQALFRHKKAKAILGCNFSIHKQDILKVNGFDMRYEAPAVGEDSDLDYRLNLIGITNKSLNYLGCQIHMYHPWLTRPSINKMLFEQTVKEGKSWANLGISSLQKGGTE